jgi:hypothetical protein
MPSFPTVASSAAPSSPHDEESVEEEAPLPRSGYQQSSMLPEVEECMALAETARRHESFRRLVQATRLNGSQLELSRARACAQSDAEQQRAPDDIADASTPARTPMEADASVDDVAFGFVDL